MTLCVTLTTREQFQENKIEMAKKMMPCSFCGQGEPDLADVITTLVQSDNPLFYANAVSLLFATNNFRGILLGQSLLFDPNPALVVELAKNHHWSAKPGEEYSIEIYPGDFLVFEKPVMDEIRPLI